VKEYGRIILKVISWERKILRRIYGLVCVNGTWRIISNKELESLYNRPDIMAEIKSRRIQLPGHVLRMESSRVPKEILDAKPERKISVERPRLRWLDDGMNDLRNVEVRQLRKKAKDRREWAGIVREARLKLKRLYS
jgi:hypothetical protein